MEAEGAQVLQRITANAADPAKTFEVFLNRKFRKVVRPPSPGKEQLGSELGRADLDPVKDPGDKLQDYGNDINELIQTVNSGHFSKDFAKFAIFEIVIKKLMLKMQNERQTKDGVWVRLIDFQSELSRRLSFQMPGVPITQIIIGHILKKSVLLIPELPKPKTTEEEREAMKSMGINLVKDKREDFLASLNRLEKFASLLFMNFRSKAYIGRGWQYLILYINMEMN